MRRNKRLETETMSPIFLDARNTPSRLRASSITTPIHPPAGQSAGVGPLA
jgi:hypothetical protein